VSPPSPVPWEVETATAADAADVSFDSGDREDILDVLPPPDELSVLVATLDLDVGEESLDMLTYSA
jgi:hypothetical protein